jgi:NAD(P)H dehydrogenase (quinone)
LSIVVTNACGRFGRALAAIMGGNGGELVLADPEPERLDAAARAGAQTRQADFRDPLTLPSAFAGAVTVLLPGGREGALAPAQAGAAIDAARAAGVERIVLLSSIAPRPGNPAVWAEADRTVEAMVRAGGMGWTILRLQESMDDFAAIGRDQQAAGRMFSNRAGGMSAPLALADAAAATAAALAEPRHAGRLHDLTGPRLVGAADLAAALGIGNVAHKDGKYLDQLLNEGLSPAAARAGVTLGRAVREGYYAVVSDDVRALAGAAPVDLAGFLAGNPPSPILANP